MAATKEKIGSDHLLSFSLANIKCPGNFSDKEFPCILEADYKHYQAIQLASSLLIYREINKAQFVSLEVIRHLFTFYAI